MEGMQASMHTPAQLDHLLARARSQRGPRRELSGSSLLWSNALTSSIKNTRPFPPMHTPCRMTVTTVVDQGKPEPVVDQGMPIATPVGADIFEGHVLLNITEVLGLTMS